MSDLLDAKDRGGDEHQLVAIPRVAEHVGVTPRVIRYWEDEA
jgi:hypothetical protein